MPTELNAEEWRAELTGLFRRFRDLPDGYELAGVRTKIEAILDTLELRAPKDEHGADWDVCWHCRVCLIVEVPRCEKCPAPGDCDDENCEADGCVEERDALVKARAPKDELAEARRELGAWLVEHPGFYLDPTSGESGEDGVFFVLLDSAEENVDGFKASATTEAAAIRAALTKARATGGDRG